MSKQLIKQAAINQFHRYGYEGVKMAQIATEAGMRKQSIYYHYPTKRDLFTELYDEVIEEEMKFLQAYFNDQPDVTSKELLYRFLKDMKRRTNENVTVVFLHLMSYSPPSEIGTFVASRYLTNFNVFKNEVRKVFEKEAFTSGAEECTLSYLTLFDGLLVHLFYNTGQSYEHALDASFEIFWKGISCKE